MLRDPEEVGVDGRVWLYPQTRTASQNVHRQLAVKIMKDPRAHWPMVVVGWTESGVDRWELVHKDNIRKKAPGVISAKEEKTQGDSIGGTASSRTKVARVRVMPSAKKYEPTEGQGTLF